MNELTTEYREIDFSNPVNLQLRIRNNILLQAIRQRAPSIAAFCRVTGYSLVNAHEYVSFKKSPVKEKACGRGKKRKAHTEWRESAIRLCTLLDLTPEEAFPPEIRVKVERNTMEVFCKASEPCAVQLTPHEELAQLEIAGNVQSVLNTLTEREQNVIKDWFGFEDGKHKTLSEIGDKYNISRERARQIGVKAMRKLRHPSRLRQLKESMDTIKELEVK